MFRIMESLVLRLQVQFMRDVKMTFRRERRETMKELEVSVLLFYGCGMVVWCGLCCVDVDCGCCGETYNKKGKW